MNAKCVVLLVVLASLAGCKSGTKKEEPVTVTGSMQNLSSSLSTLLPLAHDPIQFSEPQNRAVIDKETERLARFSHKVKSAVPAFDYIASRLSADMQEARRLMDLGNLPAARHRIRNAANYCISCHTQSPQGPHFTVAKAGAFYEKLNALDRANYLIAVRHFDDAVAEFERAMNSPDLALQPFATLEALTLKILAVAVRVKQDPKMALQIVDRMIQSKWAPVYLQLSGLKWRDSIHRWARAPKRRGSLPAVKWLVARGMRKQMESPLSRAGLIENLRASAMANELLSQARPEKEMAEIYYYAGLASEALDDLDLTDSSERHYERCIRVFPHSVTARNCYLRLEGHQLASYSAAEIPVPQAVRDNLEALKKLAIEKGASWLDPIRKAE